MIYKAGKMEDVYTLLAELATIKRKDLKVFLPEGALILRNKLNLQFLVASLEKLGKSVKFETDDPNGAEIVAHINSESAGDYGEVYASEDITSTKGIMSRVKSLFTGFAGLKNMFSRPKLPSFKAVSFQINFVLLGILTAALIGLAFGATKYVSSQKAYIKIVAKAEPIARSITIRVDSEKSTDAGQKILEGQDVSTTIIEDAEIETTGEEFEGDYATGEVTIYNRTEEEIDLDEGTELAYKDDDEDFVFKLSEEVTVPALTYEDPEDPASTMTPGEASVDVEASEFGDDYNIDEGETLEFDDYKKSELVAKSNDDFEGGTKETISIVAQEDIEKINEEVKTALEAQTDTALEDAIPSGYKIIQGSKATTLGEPEISHEVGEETDKITSRQIMTVSALTYSEKKLDQLIMQVVGEYVPDEYSLSGTKHSLSVEVLGETEDTVLSPTTADLQVTVKTAVVPDLNIDKLKQEIAGASVQEVQRTLGSMQSISTYEINLSPGIPFKSNIPSNPEKILIEIEEV